MLTDKIHLSTPSSSDPEDIFSSSRSLLFTDDITNQHGDSSTSVIYRSPQFGDLKLELARPKGEEERRLFSHYLWNAGVQLAEFIEESEDEGKGDWRVKGQRVLELGAGTGLVGVMASLMGAEETVITDYPAEEVLANISVNISYNCFSSPSSLQPLNPNIRVEGHCWGELTDPFSLENKEKFTRILVADCLWMPWQHENLLCSIRWFLAVDGRAWVVAGFHTGREKMRGFFEGERVKEYGLVVERIWEKDAMGNEREWVEDRGIEDIVGRKTWLVVGILKKVG